MSDTLTLDEVASETPFSVIGIVAQSWFREWSEFPMAVHYETRFTRICTHFFLVSTYHRLLGHSVCGNSDGAWH